MKYLYILLFLLLTSQYSKSQTWADDVACIVYTHCTSCHNSNGAAPFSLTDYTTAVSWAAAIKSNVIQGAMPPWPPDQNYNALAHSRILTEDEKDRIIKWVDNSTPQGNMANAPVAPTYNMSAQITNPDITALMPTYTVPNISVDLYRAFIITAPISGISNFISGFEVLPGNRNIVHHVLVFQDTSNTPVALDSAEAGLGYTSYGGIGSNTADLIGAWVPGSSATFYPNGMGVKLQPNARIIVQIHYPAYASLQSDSTSIRIKFNTSATREIFINPVLNPASMTNGPLSIPPNTIKTFEQKYTVPSAVSILGIAPHAHLLCQTMKSFAVSPLNDTTELLDIPEWDFHWQGSYFFPKIIKITPLTKLHGYATYDNTSANPHNPNTPPQLVTWGEATTDEMMLFYFSYTAYQSGDENIIIDTISHTPHHLNCTPTTVLAVDELDINNSILVYPNPARTNLYVSSKIKIDKLELIDMQGKVISTSPSIIGIYKTDISELPNGVYFIKLYSNSSVVYRQFVKE